MVKDEIKVRGEVFLVLRDGGVQGKIVSTRHVKNLITYVGAHWDRMLLAGSGISGYAPVPGLDLMPPSRGNNVISMWDEWPPLAQIVPGTGTSSPSRNDTGLSGSRLGYDTSTDKWYEIAGYVSQNDYYGQEYLRLSGYGIDKATCVNNPLTPMKQLILYKHFPSQSEASYSENTNSIDNNAIGEVGLFSPKYEDANSKYKRIGTTYPGASGTDVSGIQSFLTIERWAAPSSTPYQVTVTRTPLHRVAWLMDDGTGTPYWVEDGSGISFRASQDRIRLLNYDPTTWGFAKLWAAYTTQSTYSSFPSDDLRLFSRATFTPITKAPTQSLTVVWVITVVI